MVGCGGLGLGLWGDGLGGDEGVGGRMGCRESGVYTGVYTGVKGGRKRRTPMVDLRRLAAAAADDAGAAFVDLIRL